MADVKPDEGETEVGKVTHYYSKLGVAIVELAAPLKVGDTLHYKGHTTDFEDTVSSMEIEHKGVEEAKKGDVVGIKVREKVRDGDHVFKKS